MNRTQKETVQRIYRNIIFLQKWVSDVTVQLPIAKYSSTMPNQFYQFFLKMPLRGFINHWFVVIAEFLANFPAAYYFSLLRILIGLFFSLRYRYFDSLVEVLGRSRCVISCLGSDRYSLTKYNQIVTSNVLSVTSHRIIAVYFYIKMCDIFRGVIFLVPPGICVLLS